VKPDVIFHLAAQPLVRLSYAQPLETYETNVIGTAHVLDALRDADWPCAAVMVTTDKVYENREQVHAYREDEPLGGYDPYSSSKACAELVIQTYRNAYFNPDKIRVQGSACLLSHVLHPLVGVASARAGNVIGGGDWAQDRIVPDCIRALAKGEVISVRNPRATRPWQHVLEPLSGYLLLGMRLHEALCWMADIGWQKAAESGQQRKMLPQSESALSPPLSVLCSAFNFGPDNASNRPVRDLVDEIIKHWPGRWDDRSDPHALHEASLLNLCTDKAKTVLGWKPRWGFEMTLKETVSWYRTVKNKGADAASVLTRKQIADYTGQG